MRDHAGLPGAAASEARALRDELSVLRARIDDRAAATMKAWAPALPDDAFHASARNLAEYLALRQEDLRPLQHRLAALGLSSLGRCEGHVAASLDAVLAALGLMVGAPAEFPPAEAFTAGVATLAARRDALFGARAEGATRIMATLPTEAAEDPDLARRLVSAGTDAVRINCAHDDPDIWARMIAHARSAAREAGRSVAVAMDLAGPKIRTREVLRPGHSRLVRGDRFILTRSLDPDSDLPQATLTYPELIGLIRQDAAVWIDDGRLRARAVEVSPARAVLEVVGAREKGEKLKPEKGVNLPGTEVPIAALTAADLAALDFVAREADLIGFSFVQQPEDISDLVTAIDARRQGRPRPALMLKIETRLAVANLPRLIVAAAGAGPVAVMIARGDLAVEIGFERLSEIQDEIVWLCEAASVPVVWATQVLDGLLHDGMASRAETSDAALGQRAECVMLNKGPYLPEAVAFLSDVLRRMDRHHAKKFANLGPLHVWGPS